MTPYDPVSRPVDDTSAAATRGRGVTLDRASRVGSVGQRVVGDGGVGVVKSIRTNPANHAAEGDEPRWGCPTCGKPDDPGAGMCAVSVGWHYFEEGLERCRCGRLAAGSDMPPEFQMRVLALNHPEAFRDFVASFLEKLAANQSAATEGVKP